MTHNVFHHTMFSPKTIIKLEIRLPQNLAKLVFKELVMVSPMRDKTSAYVFTYYYIILLIIIIITLKITSAQVVEMSVTNNNSFQNYPHPSDQTIRTIIIITIIIIITLIDIIVTF